MAFPDGVDTIPFGPTGRVVLGMYASEVIKVAIERPFGEVYEFLADPINFARWASNPGSEAEPLSGGDWLVEVPSGQRIIRFAPRNTFGILDYELFVPGETQGRVTPVRLYRNAEGAELVFTWFQRPGQTDESFKSDTVWIASDLQRLKALVEAL